MDCTCVHCAHSAGGRTTVHTGKGTSHRGLPSHTTTDWVAWNNGGLFSHSAGGWKSEIKVCTGPLAAAGGARSWCSPARSCTRPLREAVFPPRVCLPAAPSPPVSPLQGHSHSPHLHPNPICKGSFPSTVTFPGPGSFSLSFRGMQFNPRQMRLSSQGWEQVRPAPIAAGHTPNGNSRPSRCPFRKDGNGPALSPQPHGRCGAGHPPARHTLEQKEGASCSGTAQGRASSPHDPGPGRPGKGHQGVMARSLSSRRPPGTGMARASMRGVSSATKSHGRAHEQGETFFLKG